MGLKDEIFEQPQVLQRLLESQAGNVREIADIIQQRDVDYVFLAARGTSDNAGLYLKYLWGAHNGLPIALAAPSLFTMYGQPPRLDRALVVAISQSGQSPDIVGVVREGARQGAPTLAITNDAGSPLAENAEFVLDIRAGEEKAIAATKTYTAQLLTIAMLSAALAHDEAGWEALQHLPGLVQQAVEQDSVIERAAGRYTFMPQCVVLGRGYNYATAFEWALKLKELTYVLTQPYSSADFQHGPIAIVEHGFPVLAIAPHGRVFNEMLALLRKLKDDHRADLLIISNADEALNLATTPLHLPGDVPEWLSPLVSIVLGQLFAYHLTCAKGFDPENPRGLRKVTHTE